MNWQAMLFTIAIIYLGYILYLKYRIKVYQERIDKQLEELHKTLNTIHELSKEKS